MSGAFDIYALEQCAPDVHPVTMQAVVSVESGHNPFAIGVVGGRLIRQPATKEEAIATAESLAQNGWNFSVGVGQVNRYNLNKYGLTYASAFEPCKNLQAASKILKDCFDRALPRFGEQQTALRGALSCYFSGNFKTGQVAAPGESSYVDKVLSAAAKPIAVTPVKLVSAARLQPVPAVKLAAITSAAPAGVAIPTQAPKVVAATPDIESGVPARYDGFGISQTTFGAVNHQTKNDGR